MREVALALRSDIISGRLRPGSPLAEPVLAKLFGSSRAPIREALIELASRLKGTGTFLPLFSFPHSHADAQVQLIEIFFVSCQIARSLLISFNFRFLKCSPLVAGRRCRRGCIRRL